MKNLEEDFAKGNPFEVLQERIMEVLRSFTGMPDNVQTRAQVEAAVCNALFRFLTERQPPLMGSYSELAKATQVSIIQDSIDVQLPTEVKEWLVSRLP